MFGLAFDWDEESILVNNSFHDNDLELYEEVEIETNYPIFN